MAQLIILCEGIVKYPTILSDEVTLLPNSYKGLE